jgi:hypothetical protein
MTSGAAEVLAEYRGYKEMKMRPAIGEAEAMTLARHWMPDLIVVGISIPECNGFDASLISFDAEDPVEAIMVLTGGIGVDRVIDAVGVDARIRTAVQPFRQTRRNKRSPRAARLRRSGTRTA